MARNGEAVRQALEPGEVLHLDTASEEITDEFLLFAIKSGLLQQWAAGFPDPRNWSDISCEVILAAEVAARFAGIYSNARLVMSCVRRACWGPWATAWRCWRMARA